MSNSLKCPILVNRQNSNILGKLGDFVKFYGKIPDILVLITGHFGLFKTPTLRLGEAGTIQTQSQTWRLRKAKINFKSVRKTINKINPSEIDSLNRLAVVQESGMGALTYQPEHKFETPNQESDYDKLAQECSKILESQNSDNLDELFKLGGSSGGARPKILTKINGEDWIIKFPSSQDPKNIGEQEYKYSLVAKDCGIKMSETRLFESKNCSGYFGIKRFDRENGKKVHMVSVSGLLETSHRLPNLDYNILMKLTLELTKNYKDIEQLYRLMCFNVFAHNRDDHSKNFSFLYDENKKEWHLSPAYDLTYSSSFNGEHATTINGEGKNPSLEDILAVAKNIGIKEKHALDIALDIKDKCSSLVD